MASPQTNKTFVASVWPKVVLVGVIVFLVIAGGMICFEMAMRDFFHGAIAGRSGAVKSSNDWPRPLKELVADAKSADIDLQVFEVHCMCRGMENEYIWRMSANSKLLDFLKNRWRLSPDDPPQHGIFCGQSMFSGDATPSWWTPKENSETAFYVCELSLKGEKGERFHLAYDKKRDCFFVWYWDNW
jgi:hypothetical protein